MANEGDQAKALPSEGHLSAGEHRDIARDLARNVNTCDLQGHLDRLQALFQNRREKPRLKRRGRKATNAILPQDLPPPTGWMGAWPPLAKDMRKSVLLPGTKRRLFRGIQGDMLLPIFVIIYLRVSSKEQEKKHGLNEQLRSILKACAKYGVMPLAIYWEDAPGTSFKRAGWRECVAAAQTLGTGAIAVDRMDRFSRVFYPADAVLRELSDCGTSLMYKPRNGSTKFLLADMNDSDVRMDALHDLDEAANNYQVIRDNTMAPARAAIEAGRTWGGLKRKTLYFQDANDGRWAIRPEAAALWDHFVAKLTANCTRATVKALAKENHFSVEMFLREAATDWATGNYTFDGLHPEDNFQPHMKFRTQEQRRELLELLGRALTSQPQVQPPTALGRFLDGRDHRRIYIESDGRLAPWCEACLTRMELYAVLESGTKPCDEYICANGHREYHPGAILRRAGAQEYLPSCGYCLESAYMAWVGFERDAAGQRWSRYLCGRVECGHETKFNGDKDPHLVPGRSREEVSRAHGLKPTGPGQGGPRTQGTGRRRRQSRRRASPGSQEDRPGRQSTLGA